MRVNLRKNEVWIIKNKFGRKVKFRRLESLLKKFMTNPPKEFPIKRFRLSDIFNHGEFLRNYSIYDRETFLRLNVALRRLGYFDSNVKPGVRGSGRVWVKNET